MSGNLFGWVVPIVLLAGCGNIVPSTDGGAGSDAEPGDGGGSDADPCAAFETPFGATVLHNRFCAAALGSNPSANPTTMTLPCPSTDGILGMYGRILRPAAIDQANGCPATTPITRITAPSVLNAITQTSTGQDVVVTDGDHFRMRVSCPTGVANCRAELQVTGAPAAGVGNIQIFPTGVGGGFALIQGEEVLDVDVEIPSGLVGPTTDLNVIVRCDGMFNPDLLIENPHLAPPP